jgi:hypothetical protein
MKFIENMRSLDYIKNENYKDELIDFFNSHAQTVTFLKESNIHINKKSEMLILFNGEDSFSDVANKFPFSVLRYSNGNLGTSGFPNFISYCYYQQNILNNDNKEDSENAKFSSDDGNSCENVIKAFNEEGVDSVL